MLRFVPHEISKKNDIMNSNNIVCDSDNGILATADFGLELPILTKYRIVWSTPWGNVHLRDFSPVDRTDSEISSATNRRIGQQCTEMSLFFRILWYLTSRVEKDETF